MKETIWFDMDGTIADFYSVQGWLEDLTNECARPYAEAEPLFAFSAFARLLHKCQKKGYTIGIVTWGSKHASKNFNQMVENTKKEWLKKHLPSVEWDYFRFMAYGTNKNLVNNGNDILFDDEEKNRKNWQGRAFLPFEIKEVMKGLI